MMCAIKKTILCLLIIGVLIIPSNNAIGEIQKIKYQNSNIFINTNDTASHGSGGGKGDVIKHMTSSGVNRDYKLRVPTSYNQNIAVPLLIYMHGAGGNYNEGEYFWTDSYIETKRIIFCTPSANDTNWGSHWWDLTAWYYWRAQSYIDSIFFMQLINKTIQEYNIDLSRIWLTGFSDGGTMSIRMGVFLSHMLSVSCPHSASWSLDNLANPSWAQRKMPFYARIGSGDSSRIPTNNAAQSNFTAAGFEYKLDVVNGVGHDWAPDSCDKFVDFESIRPLQHNWIRPSLVFNYPAPKEKWAAGSQQTIEWWLGCGNPSYQVKLEISINGHQGLYSTITTLTQTDCGLNQYVWNIPTSTPTSKNAVLRAIVQDSSSVQKMNVTVMNYTFEITPNAVSEVSILLVSFNFIAIITCIYYNRKKYKNNKDT